MSTWYDKAKSEKDEIERRNRLQEQNFQQLKHSGLLEKIKSVKDRVNQNTLYKVEFQEMGSRIEVFLDSRHGTRWIDAHFRIEARYDGIVLIYGARSEPDTDFDSASRFRFSKPLSIEPETITEVEIENWIGNLSNGQILQHHLHGHHLFDVNTVEPEPPPTLKQGLKSQFNKLLYSVVLILLLSAIIISIYSHLIKGCR